MKEGHASKQKVLLLSIFWRVIKVNNHLILSALPDPKPWPGTNRKLLLGGGSILLPLQVIEAFSDHQFELFILEWVHGYLYQNYDTVQQRGGSGDKGRDIIAWIEPHGTAGRKWDNYQCKHYKAPLTPSQFWVELGKLCYYTFSGDYTIPENYYIVTHQGVGNSMHNLLDNPTKFNEGLIDNWNRYCEKGITDTKEIKLEGSLRDYVVNFNFSIIKELPPIDLLDQHRQTCYHAILFQTQLKPRPPAPKPPPTIAACEMKYIQKMFEAFADHTKTDISSDTDFNHIKHLRHFFSYSRECFYCAESLKEFARDNLPDDTDYVDFENQILEGIQITLNAPHQDGYCRMSKTCEKAQEVQITSNVLISEARPYDRVGMCHHLANKDKIGWV